MKAPIANWGWSGIESRGFWLSHSIGFLITLVEQRWVWIYKSWGLVGQRIQRSLIQVWPGEDSLSPCGIKSETTFRGTLPETLTLLSPSCCLPCFSTLASGSILFFTNLFHGNCHLRVCSWRMQPNAGGMEVVPWRRILRIGFWGWIPSLGVDDVLVAVIHLRWTGTRYSWRWLCWCLQ